MSAPLPLTGSFFKLEALGNDFVLVDARARRLDLDAAQIRAMANRRTGIGFDQLLVLRRAGEAAPADATPVDTALAYIEIFNADGSRAEQCGNGMRAIAAWLERVGELSADTRVDTPAGPVVLARSPDGGFSADLPGPEPLDPVALDLPPPSLPACAGAWQLVSLGNPHLIVDWPERPTPRALAEVATMLGDGPWHNRANIGLMYTGSEGAVTLRVHERGAGPTPACGSAACAAAWVAARARSRPGPISVEQSGGTLVVDLSPGAARAITFGPASVVFEGRIA